MSARVRLLLPALVAFAACESRVDLTDDTHGPDEISATAERSQVRLTWSAVEGADHYEVFQGRDPGVSPEVYTRLLVATSAELVVQQVIPGTFYHFVVAAIVDGERTEISGEVSTAALEDAPVSTAPAWTHQGDTGSRFGASVASARDVDKDGRGDLVVGSPSWFSTSANAQIGSIDVFLGTAGGLENEPAFTIAGKQTNAGFGSTVLGIPDVDGDGFDDVLASEPRGFFDDSGRVFAYHGNGDGTLAPGNIGCFPGGIECAFVFAFDFFANAGSALGSFDDLTGDGLPEILVGSPFVSSTAGGLIELFETYNGGSVSYPAMFSFRSTELGDAFGAAVASGLDVTGDGIPDAVVGAPLRANGRGRVSLFVGSGATLAEGGPVWTADGDAEGDELGRSITIVDLTCDGVGDVVIGLPGWDDGLVPDVGLVRIYRGGPPPLELFDEVKGIQEGETLGVVAAIGNVDGFGCDDLLIGSPAFDGIFDDEGRAQIFLGGTEKLSDDPIWSDFGRSPSARFGEAVSGAGDLDGDGFRDIAVGAPDFDANGQVAAYRGLAPSGPRPSAGLPLRAEPGEAVAPMLAGFSDPTTAQAFQCTWTWGDGEPDTIVSPCSPQNVGQVAHVWTESGSYRVRLSVVRADGVRGEAITTVRVE